jgi:hypothetical protein
VLQLVLLLWVELWGGRMLLHSGRQHSGQLRLQVLGQTHAHLMARPDTVGGSVRCSLAFGWNLVVEAAIRFHACMEIVLFEASI